MIKIGDFFENTEVLVDNYNSTCIIFKVRLNILLEDYFRRIIFLINDVVKNYKGNVSSNISLFEDGISTIECSFEGDDHWVRSNLFMSEISNKIFPERRKFPIYIGNEVSFTGKNFIINILIYNTISQETCDEINNLIKDFCGEIKNNEIIRVHNYFDPIQIDISFKDKEAALWFQKTLKLIEQTE